MFYSPAIDTERMMNASKRFAFLAVLLIVPFPREV